MLKNLLGVTIATLCFSSFSQANTSVAANPKHIELFDTRNFCVVCTFNDAILSPDTLHNRWHVNTNISASYMYGTLMDRLDLTFGFLYAIKGEHFTIQNSLVRMINLSYSDLPYFTFIGNQGELVNFTGTGLTEGNFREAELDSPIFTETALWYTDFTRVKFKNALFINAYIREANFSEAQLMNADFTNASLIKVNFTDANLRDAKLTTEQLQDSIVCNAILPDGSRGAC